MNKTLLIFLFAFITINVVAGVVFLFSEPPRPAPTLPTNISVVSVPNSTNNPMAVIEPSGISQSELALHNSGSDCWVAYEGNVYDITKFLPKHPGSAAAIIPYCGTAQEFADAFTDQHGKSQVKTLVSQGTLKGDLL